MSAYEYICFSVVVDCRKSEMPRVQIEDLCEGCISLCEAQNIVKTS